MKVKFQDPPTPEKKTIIFQLKKKKLNNQIKKPKRNVLKGDRNLKKQRDGKTEIC